MIKFLVKLLSKILVGTIDTTGNWIFGIPIISIHALIKKLRELLQKDANEKAAVFFLISIRRNKKPLEKVSYSSIKIAQFIGTGWRYRNGEN